MAGRIDEIQHVRLAIVRFVVHRHRMGLNRNAAFAFQVHIIQHLRLFHFGQRAGLFKNSIGQRRFTVVNMRDDAKISDLIQVHKSLSS